MPSTFRAVKKSAFLAEQRGGELSNHPRPKREPAKSLARQTPVRLGAARQIACTGATVTRVRRTAQTGSPVRASAPAIVFAVRMDENQKHCMTDEEIT